MVGDDWNYTYSDRIGRCAILWRRRQSSPLTQCCNRRLPMERIRLDLLRRVPHPSFTPLTFLNLISLHSFLPCLIRQEFDIYRPFLGSLLGTLFYKMIQLIEYFVEKAVLEDEKRKNLDAFVQVGRVPVETV